MGRLKAVKAADGRRSHNRELYVFLRYCLGVRIKRLRPQTSERMERAMARRAIDESGQD